jgi:hypothetical protein
MKKAEYYLDKFNHPFMVSVQMEDKVVSEVAALQAIKQAQIDAIEATVKLCADNVCMRWIPFTDHDYEVDEQSILNCAEILKKEL